MGIKGKPSASDIQRYFTIQESSKRLNKKKVSTIKVISHWQKRISVFKGIAKVKQPFYNTDVDVLLEMMRTGANHNLKSRITQLRSITDKDDFDKLKGSLPVATWNGVFNYRDASGCNVYSSFTALDFDHVENLVECKQWLKSIPCVYSYFLSPSGKGIKAIVLHDNRRKDRHDDLYSQLMTKFKGHGNDSSTSDLGRGNYLSYDTEVWVNPKPEAYHYEPSEIIEDSSMPTHTVVKSGNGEPILMEDDDYTSFFLQRLCREILSDDSIINMLRKKWTQQSLARGRNNTALSYAGILCKAGVDPSKATDFIQELIPDLPNPEIVRAVKYAYEHNIFACNRRAYIKRKRR